MPETKIEVSCENPICGKTFLRRKTEVKRSVSLGRRSFCCKSCQAKVLLNEKPSFVANKGQISFLRNEDGSSKYNPSKLDEYSPFRRILRKLRQRAKEDGKELNLSLSDLKDLWESQNGICPFTGWSLVLPSSTSSSYKLEYSPKRASLDRIDNAKGYIKGNVQFVCLMYQHAKNSFRDEDVLLFCRTVVNHFDA